MRPTDGSEPVGRLKQYAPMERAKHGKSIRNQPPVMLWWDTYGRFVGNYGFCWQSGHKIPKLFRKALIRTREDDVQTWEQLYDQSCEIWIGQEAACIRLLRARDPVDLWTSFGTRTAHVWGPRDCLRSLTGPKIVGSLYLKVVPVQLLVTGWMAPLQFTKSANNRAGPTVYLAITLGPSAF